MTSIVLAVAIATCAQAPTIRESKAEAYEAAANRQRLAKVESLDAEIKRQTQELRKRPAPANAKDRGKRLVEMRKELAGLKANRPAFVPVIEPGGLSLGAIGTLDRGEDVPAAQFVDSRGVTTIEGRSQLSFRLVSIRPNADLLVEPHYWTNGGADRRPRDRPGKRFAVRGLDSEALTTGEDIEIPGVYEVGATVPELGEKLWVLTRIDVD